MNEIVKQADPPTVPARRPRTLSRVLLWTSGIALLVLIALLITGDILLHRAGPMLKAEVVETLSSEFDSRVELDTFHVSGMKGFEVVGSGLKLYPNHLDMAEPLLQVERFSFHALHWRQLLRSPIYINKVEVRGLTIHMPPKSQRTNLPHFASGQAPGADQSLATVRILVGEFLVDRAVLVLENGKPNKVPLTFLIHKVRLNSVGAGRPWKFDAMLINPKPVGDIHSTGSFGPFDAESPGDTPVNGKYTFRNADLGPIKGIAGILSSDGTYQGPLNNLIVDGETSTPDFRLDTANHAVPLNTKFHAIVDGTNGDVHLQPVDAWLRDTHIVARGDVVRQAGAPGREIQLDVTVQPGRMQDLLQLAVKTEPPLMIGQAYLHTSFDLPPGPQSVTEKLRLQGRFDVFNAHFTTAAIQSKVDQLSLRGQGHPGKAKAESDAMKAGNDHAATAADVASEMRGNFTFGNEQLHISMLNFQVPGAQIALSGVYSLDGQVFDFTGTARMQAHVSQMVSGWKSWLLMPVDPFFAKNGAGTEVPIKITGTRSEPQIGLNFH